MRFEQLRIFLHILESGSLASAARLLHMSQPAVSLALSSLEKELGRPLIIRSTGQRKPVTPTAAGVLFAEYAKDACLRFENMRARLDEAAPTEGHPLNIGATPTPSSSVLPVLAGRFRETYANAPLSLFTCGGKNLIHRLYAGDYDIAVTGARPLQEKDLDFDRFFYDPVELICPASMGLVGPITVGQLRRLPLIIREPSGNLTRLLLQEFSNFGLTLDSLNIVMHVSGNNDVLSSVALGAGAGFIARSLLAANRENKNIVHVRIKRFRVDRYLYLVRLRHTPFRGTLRLFWQFAMGYEWREGVFNYNTMLV